MAGLLNMGGTGNANQFWGDALYGLGRGLLSYSSNRNPGQAGLAFGDAMQQAQAQREAQDYKKVQQRLLEIGLENQQRQQAQQAAEDAQKQQALQAYKTLVGGNVVGPNGPQLPSAPSPTVQQLPQNIQALLPAMSPDQGMKFLSDYQTTQMAGGDAPTIKDFYEGNKVTQKQWNPTTRRWDTIGSGPRWQPDSGQSQLPSDIREYQYAQGQGFKGSYMDWVANKKGAGIQVDTNGDGQPDIVVGGSGMKPPTEATGQAGTRGTMLSQGLEDVQNIDFNKVNPNKMAVAEMASNSGTLGQLGADYALNDDEKKLLGAQGKIQEAVISAITGAAYSEEQKRSMREAYVVKSTDSTKRRMEKLRDAADFLKQLDRNSGGNRVGGQESPDYASKYGLTPKAP